MVARTGDPVLSSGQVPDGFVIEQRLDERTLPSPIVFDVFRNGKRVAWGLRSRDAALRWADRLAGARSTATPIASRRIAPSAPWWNEAS